MCTQRNRWLNMLCRNLACGWLLPVVQFLRMLQCKTDHRIFVHSSILAATLHDWNSTRLVFGRGGQAGLKIRRWHPDIADIIQYTRTDTTREWHNLHISYIPIQTCRLRDTKLNIKMVTSSLIGWQSFPLIFMQCNWFCYSKWNNYHWCHLERPCLQENKRILSHHLHEKQSNMLFIRF